jgi:hypothetical protein
MNSLILFPNDGSQTSPKGLFGSHHLGLESKNSFVILTITCLVTTELVMEFIWNSMCFHLMPNLNTYWVPYHFCEFFKMKWYHHVISFHFYQMKWNDGCQTSDVFTRIYYPYIQFFNHDETSLKIEIQPNFTTRLHKLLFSKQMKIGINSISISILWQLFSSQSSITKIKRFGYLLNMAIHPRTHWIS